MSLLAVRDERLATRVGVVILIVLAAVTGFLAVAYHRIDWTDRIRVTVFFHDVGGLREGAPFVVGGREVGRVESISPVPRGRVNPLGGEPGIAVTVTIDADVAARTHARTWPWPKDQAPPMDVFVGSRGIVSQRHLELAPAPVGAPRLRDGDQLLGSDPATLDSVMQRTFASMLVARAFGEQVRPEFAALRRQVSLLVDHLAGFELDVLGDDVRALVAELRRTHEALGGSEGLANAGDVVDEARLTIAQLRLTIDVLAPKFHALRHGATRAFARARVGEMIAKIEPIVGELRGALAKAETLLAHVNLVTDRVARGEGSLLKLIFDPEFTEDFKDLGKVIKRKPWKMIATDDDG